MKGAEAIIKKDFLFRTYVIRKIRIKKRYRPEKLDQYIREFRTKNEARLLNKAKLCGVKCPIVFGVFKYEIIMSYIEGEEPVMNQKDLEDSIKLLSRLHNHNIVHGDFTKKNLLRNGADLYVIDFGLGKISNKIEDKAVDLYTFIKSVDYNKFAISLYKKLVNNSKSIIKRYEEIRKRIRYA